MATQWYRRFIAHVFGGRELLSETVLREIATELQTTRKALQEVYGEITLAMNALDVMELRMGRLSEHPVVQGEGTPQTPPIQPLLLTREQRQRTHAG
jgi:hypothetical protein